MTNSLNYFNYRLIRLDSGAYSISEVFYDDTDDPILWADEIYGETPHVTHEWIDKITEYVEIMEGTQGEKNTLKERIASAFEKPILEIKDMPGYKEFPIGLEDDGLFTREE